MLTTYDWSGCPLIQRDPEKMGGQPTVGALRLTPDALVENFNSGCDIAELLELYPGTPVAAIRVVLEYAEKQGYLERPVQVTASR